MSAISGLGGSASELQANYMTLLVTQLQNQNPLDPMDNSQMASQLAQMSQLQLTETLNSKLDTLNTNFTTKFDEALLVAQVNQGTSMIGKNISFFPPNADKAVTTKVTGVDVVDSEVRLRAGDFSVGLGAVLSVTE